MLELFKLANISSGVAVGESKDGGARFVRLSDLSDLKTGRTPTLARGEAPAVARALMIEEGDLIVGARGIATDVCVATDAVIGAFVSLDLYLVRPDRTVVDPEYLVAFLELPGTQRLLAGGKQGSSLARLPKDVLEEIEIPLPPKRSQQLIGQLAHACDEERGLLKRLAHLRSSLNAEAVARAFRATDSRCHSKGSQL